MLRQTGESYKSTDYNSLLLVDAAKSGKTFFSVASALGLLPWQTKGGIVSHPRDLHIISLDTKAVDGVKEMLLELGASKEALQYNVWNFEADARRITESPISYNHDFFNELTGLYSEIQEIVGRNRGTPVVLFSSLTTLANVVERALMGAPTGQSQTGKGYGSIDLWKMLSAQLWNIQSMWQSDRWHCLWEGHIYQPPKPPQGEAQPATIQVSGATGRNWGVNTGGVLRLRRSFGVKYPNTKIDKVYMETRPSLEFVSNGRGFTTRLKEQETDLADALERLGHKVGHWGAKSAPPKPAAPTAAQPKATTTAASKEK